MLFNRLINVIPSEQNIKPIKYIYFYDPKSKPNYNKQYSTFWANKSNTSKKRRTTKHQFELDKYEWSHTR